MNSQPDDPNPNRHDPGPASHAAGPDQSGQPREVLRLRDAGDLLTVVPYFLGYQPGEPSLAVIGFKDLQVVLTARIDLPALAGLPAVGGLPGAWIAFTAALVTSGADTVTVIAYAGRDWTTPLRRFADSAPLPVVDVLRVHDGRWWSLDCPDPCTCPHPACAPGGAKLIEQPAVTAPLVAGGAVIPGTRAELAAALQPGPADLIASVTASLNTQPRRGRRDLHAELAQAHDARASGPAPLSPGQAAVLLHAVADVHVRDHCLSWADDAAWWLWHDVIHTAPPGWAAPVATLIAVAAYQRGDGVLASLAAERALADVPGYGLARLIRSSLRAAVPPEAIRTLITEALAAHLLDDLDARPDDGARPGDDRDGQGDQRPPTP
jgi:Domain of unknown function (DUF4192)